MNATSYEFERARQKRETAALLRSLAPDMAVPGERTALLQRAETLEAEAVQLELGRVADKA